jgi:polyisoprenoid-binding protein YceI
MKTPATATQTKWSIDQAHSEIAFKVRHLMIAYAKGTFKTFDASIYTSGKDFTTVEIDLWIDAASISTSDVKRDEHLRSADFFDVANHKQITFTASTIGKPDKEGNHEVWGELTIKGITKNIKLNAAFGGIATDPWKNEKAGFTVTGKLKRSDYGLIWNAALETGGVMVSDEVSITCEIEVINSGPKDSIMKLEPESDKKTVIQK